MLPKLSSTNFFRSRRQFRCTSCMQSSNHHLYLILCQQNNKTLCSLEGLCDRFVYNLSIIDLLFPPLLSCEYWHPTKESTCEVACKLRKYLVTFIYKHKRQIATNEPPNMPLEITFLCDCHYLSIQVRYTILWSNAVSESLSLWWHLYLEISFSIVSAATQLHTKEHTLFLLVGIEAFQGEWLHQVGQLWNFDISSNQPLERNWGVN